MSLKTLRNLKRAEFAKKIKSYAELGKDWDSYGANPPSAGTIEKAIWFLDKLTDEELLTVQPVPTHEAIEFEGENFSIRIWKE